jgi:acid phosphatase type 7
VAYFASGKPFYYARGNHKSRRYAARDFKDFFDFEKAKMYYSCDNGPVHFIIQDCGEYKTDNNRYYYSLYDYDA